MGKDGHRAGKYRVRDLSAEGKTRREPLRGNPTSLLARLGFPHAIEAAWWGGGAGLSEGFGEVDGIRSSLERRVSEVLVKSDWPVMCRAWGCAQRGEARELVALDVSYVPVGLTEAASRASRRVGRQQLEALLPLRDQRVVQRFWSALDAGQARGWHPVVYGMWLAVYAVPLRQGLMHYAEAVIRSWLTAALEETPVESGEVERLLEAQLLPLGAILEDVLSRELPDASSFCRQV